jgi:hypothetical protein
LIRLEMLGWPIRLEMLGSGERVMRLDALSRRGCTLLTMPLDAEGRVVTRERTPSEMTERPPVESTMDGRVAP